MKKIFCLLFMASVVTSCSTKKTGVTSRTYHRITSWYNTIFNGNVTLEENLKSKREAYRDNFSEIIKVDPIDPFEESSLEEEMTMYSIPKQNNTLSNFNSILGVGNNNTTESPKTQGLNRVIEKGKNAIENHSMLIKGKEYNSMLGEAYLLLARAYYYKQEPFEALNYLNIMNGSLVKNRQEKEAKIYLALTQEQAGNTFEADEVYTQLLKEKLKKQDRKLLYNSYAQYLLNQERYPEAITSLETAKKFNKGKYPKGRYSFIQGQLSEKLNKEEDAINYYQMAYKKKPSPELEIKSQIALSGLLKGDSTDYQQRIKFLKKLTRQGLYQSRKNELYYAMAVAAHKQKRDEEAKEFYIQSLKEKESDPQIRGLVYRSLGDLYFSKPDYVYAGAYYDSAVAKIMDPEMKRKLMVKNKTLKEVIQKYYLIKKNDSILSVANMNPDEQRNYFQKHIDRLKEEEEKNRIALEKELESENTTVFETEFMGAGTTQVVTATPTTGNKWYFYNNSLKQNGISDFKKNWGDRSLMDNWRMYRKSSVNLDEVKEQLLGKKDAKNSRRFEIDYYLEKLPKNKEDLEALKQQRDTAELSLGLMYYDRFNDVSSAVFALDHLVSTPPKEDEVKVKALYNLYRINKEKNPQLASRYSDRVIAEFPNTKYAESILNPSIDIFKLNSTEATAFYEEVYKKYEEGKYKEVKALANEALQKFPSDVMIGKFSLLAAFSDAKLGNKQAFLESLERISIAFEGKEEGKKAKELLNYFTKKELEEKAKQSQKPKTEKIPPSVP
ncbi:hypothetical protein ETU09_01795 [Apibacter muscae]|uniref:Tetratricopeptide repeat protein n=1 Tax=Apibacter muscae TaxID=2509004 RepID=A0A563DHQ8_9FLAO|nr:hypothetical protein [Apibacter muscae]TWP29735.1 hypothetical protein ETU09_01795 [Apibacter muscae]